MKSKIYIINDLNHSFSIIICITCIKLVSFKYMRKSLFIIAALLLFFTSASSQVPQIEKDALIALYNATDGSNWTDNTNWNTGNPVSTWYGVTVVNNQVTELFLANNQLTDNIPHEIGNLSNLKKIWLDGNLLTGSIPSEIGNLSNLQDLNFSNNQLTGSIPSELGNLTNLETLYLYGNQLTGNIPPELGNLLNLQCLCMWENQLTGSIPIEIGNLINLHAILWRITNSRNIDIRLNVFKSEIVCINTKVYQIS